MGLRFDFSTVNWVAHLLQPGSPIPAFGEAWEEKEALRIFLHKTKNRFYSSRRHEQDYVNLVDRTEWKLQRIGAETRISSTEILREIRHFFRNRPWTALLIPSGRDKELDNFLCGEEYLQQLVAIKPEDPGIILQLEELPPQGFSLLDEFSAFRTALADSNRWPGVLIWSNHGHTMSLPKGQKFENDSVFLPFGDSTREGIKERCGWIFTELATAIGSDLELLRNSYFKTFPSAAPSRKKNIHFIHLSDLHIGSTEAALRLPRVQQFVRDLVEELGSSGEIVPIISGDVMDSPKTAYVPTTRAFIDFLSGISDKDPLVVLGNHDVRKMGVIAKNFEKAIRLPFTNRMVWYDDARIGMLCINSVTDGLLARGCVGEEQLLSLGNEIDRKADWNEFSMLAMLHHHPVVVERPEWYLRPFYERVLGDYYEETDVLKDAIDVMAFFKQRKVAAVLHGHKHIPYIGSFEKRFPVMGCGSSVGKVSTKDGSTYMSVNVISVEGQTRRVTLRLLAERVPGGGLRSQKRHEFILRT